MQRLSMGGTPLLINSCGGQNSAKWYIVPEWHSTLYAGAGSCVELILGDSVKLFGQFGHVVRGSLNPHCWAPAAFTWVLELLNAGPIAATLPTEPSV